MEVLKKFLFLESMIKNYYHYYILVLLEYYFGVLYLSNFKKITLN